MPFPVPVSGNLGSPSRYGPLDLATRPLPPWMTAASDGTTPLAIPGGGGGPARAAGDQPQLPAGPPPASLMAAGTPEPIFTPPPVQPLQAVDPMRMSGSVGEDAGPLPPGDVIRVNPTDPRSRNPFLSLTEGTDANGKGTGRAQWQSSMQQSNWGPNGFTPGFMSSGVGGQQQWASSPMDAMLIFQQNAAQAGLDPRVNLQALLGMQSRGADAQNAANLAAQQGNTQLGVARMQSEGQRANAAADAASRERVAGIESASRYDQARLGMLGQAAAAFGANPNMNPQVLETIGRLAGTPGTGLPGGPAPAGLVPPAAQPGAGAGAAAATGGQPNGIGAIADQARHNQFVQSLRGAFPMNPDGTPSRDQPITPDHAAALLDRLQAANATPEQRQAVYTAINNGTMGDPTAVRNAILQASAAAQFRAAPPTQANGQPVPFMSSSPATLPPFAVNGDGGRPLYRMQVGPVSVAGLGRSLFSGGVPYNQIVGPNGEVVPLNPSLLRGLLPDSTPGQTHRNRAAQGNALIQMFGQPPAALAPR